MVRIENYEIVLGEPEPHSAPLGLLTLELADALPAGVSQLQAARLLAESDPKGSRAQFDPVSGQLSADVPFGANFLELEFAPLTQDARNLADQASRFLLCLMRDAAICAVFELPALELLARPLHARRPSTPSGTAFSGV